MIKYVVTISITIFSFCVISGQNQEEIISYHTFVKNEYYFSKARNFYKNFEIDSAINTLEKIKCIKNGCRYKNYYLAKYSSIVDSIKSYEYLKLSVSQGQRLFYINYIFPYKIDSTELKRIENNYLNSLNFDIIKSLKDAFSRDQLIRKNWKKLHQTKEYKMELLKIDSSNQKLLDSIYYEHGWPGYSLIGRDFELSDLGFGFDIHVLLFHSGKEYIKKYIKPVREACEKDEDNWIHYKDLLMKMLKKSSIRDTLICDFIHINKFLDGSINIEFEIECIIQFVRDRIEYDHMKSSNPSLKLLLNEEIGAHINNELESLFKHYSNNIIVSSEYYDSNFFIENPNVLFLVKF